MSTASQTQSVESFSLWLSGFDALLESNAPVQAIEALLLSQLEAPVRLLRWAIVQMDGTCICCEGAYLRLER